jgi:hypothetical protein
VRVGLALDLELKSRAASVCTSPRKLLVYGCVTERNQRRPRAARLGGGGLGRGPRHTITLPHCTYFPLSLFLSTMSESRNQDARRAGPSWSSARALSAACC